MADVELVITIPEEIRIAISEMGLLRIPYEMQKNVDRAIQRGTPIPKGHGDLIDRSELYNQTANWESQALEQVNKYDPMYTRDDWRWWTAVLKERGAFKHDVADAKTIIPADKEGD